MIPGERDFQDPFFFFMTYVCLFFGQNARISQYQDRGEKIPQAINIYCGLAMDKLLT